MTDFHAFEHVGEEASLQTSPKLAESRRANLSLKEKATIQKFANVLHRGNLTRSSTTSYPNWIHAEGRTKDVAALLKDAYNCAYAKNALDVFHEELPNDRTRIGKKLVKKLKSRQ